MNIMEFIREKQDKLLNKDNRFDSKSVVSSVDLWLSQFENTNTKTYRAVYCSQVAGSHVVKST